MPSNSRVPVEARPSSVAVGDAFEKLAASGSFRRAEQCLRLLRYVTTLALDGRSDQVKEYTLGVAVFERPPTYDPRIDPVVRLTARRLRLKLAEYYQHEGLDDPVIIGLPKGGYVPDFRFRHVAEPAAEPESESVTVSGSRRKLRIWLTAAVAVMALSLTGFYTLSRRLPGLEQRPSIAVLGFRDLSPRVETSWVSPAMSELMDIDLGSEQRLRIVPLTNVARMQTELSVAPQSAFPFEVLQRIRTNLRSDYVVSGSYSMVGAKVRMNVMLFDARSGRLMKDISEEGTRDQLAELGRQCAERIRLQLGVRSSAGAPAAPMRADALEPYARGMQLLRQGDAVAARPWLEKATLVAASNPLPHAGLAEAWSKLGLDNRAAQEAKLAYDSAGSVGRVEQLEIEGRYRQIVHDWPRAIQVYQALFTLLPDSLEDGLQLASVQTMDGMGQDALRTVTMLRRLGSPLAEDPRIDLAEARAAGALSDFVHTQKAAQAAAERARALGARLEYARARLLEAGAMLTLGMAGADVVRGEARDLCAELGDRACVVTAYRIEANQMVAHGKLEAARALYQSALEFSNQTGNALEKLNAVNGLAYIANLQGDLSAAEDNLRQAYALGSQIGPDKRSPACIDLAAVLGKEGRIKEARALIEEALQSAIQIGVQQSIGLSRAARGRLLSLEGNDSAANGEYTEAIDTLRRVNDRWELEQILLEFGEAQLKQGDLSAARKSIEEADRIVRGFSPAEFSREEVELAFARLSFGEGHFAEAASHARSALSGFTASGREADRLEACAVLERALVSQGLAAEASHVLREISGPGVRKKLPEESVLEFQIARCFVLARTGRGREALLAMDVINADTARFGVRKWQTEALQARNALATTADMANIR